MEDPLYALGYKDFNPVSLDTDDVAYEYVISRDAQDEWAVRSHQNYGEPWNAGKFEAEILLLKITLKNQESFTLNIDEQYRPNTSLDSFKKSKPVYGTRAITSGNAPGLNDGAAAILFMTRAKADDLGLEPLAEIISMTSIDISPLRMNEGPAYAAVKALKLLDMSIHDINVMEINEAFAAVPLVSSLLMADKDKYKAKRLRQKTNTNGSEIAIGHPNTASGARLIMNLTYELGRRGGGFALGAICGSLAQADAC